MAARDKIPSYRRQRRKIGADTAFVVLDERRIYLGAWGTPQSREAYARAIGEWVARGRRVAPPAGDIRIVELAALFMDHAVQYYRRPDGTPTSGQHNFRLAVKPLVALYGRTLAVEFTPARLRTVRQEMIEADWSRNVINQMVGLIRGVFRWSVAEGYVPVDVYSALGTLAPLRRGRSSARETEPRRPVPIEHVEAIRPHVSRQVWTLVQLQLLTGARGGELVRMRALDLDTSAAVWVCRVQAHKTAHHGHTREIFLGPKCQDLLREFIAKRPFGHLFSPADAETERYAARPTRRRPNQKPSPRKTDRTLGEHYRADTYCQAIQRACRLADVPKWSPHQLRHTAATLLRASHGIDVAQTILGHRLGSGITEIYAEANRSKAMDVMANVG